MKLTVFQSDKGDCLLLTGRADAARILIDGGMRASYTEFVAPALGKIAAKGQPLDLVVLSHIDRDHIGGVLQLVDDLVEWRVHEYQISHDNPSHPAPKTPVPPQVKEIWHNAFHEMVGKNAGPVEEMLAASAVILSAAEASEGGLSDEQVALLTAVAAENRDLATSIPEAIQLSRRVSPQQLGISLNQPFGGKLAFVRADAPRPDPICLGAMEVYVIGPFKQDLDKLRREWNTWLAKNKSALAEIERKARRDAERLGNNDVGCLLELRANQAKALGEREKVTTPNLASLMLFVVEDGKTILLTGDGHADDILKGLAFDDQMDDQGRIHVNVLKVQHHGSEFNTNPDFAARVSADHYVFCGNGEHGNPDLDVVQLYIDARLGGGAVRADHPGAGGPFKLWFNSSESATRREEAKAHMQKLQDLVARAANASGGRLSYKFLEGKTPSFTLEV